jgi:prolyl oligopeptidase
LWNYPRLEVPFERGGQWFQSRHLGLAAQPTLYVMDAPSAPGRALLDPNLLSADGTTAISVAGVSDGPQPANPHRGVIGPQRMRTKT